MPAIFLLDSAAAFRRMAAAAEVGDRVKAHCILAICLAAAAPVRSARRVPAAYYVTVAGLGGEPDYEQRFTALAKDLDKLLKASGSDVARLHADRQRCHSRASDRHARARSRSEAKPEDDFVLILIGHGSFDGVEYKFNLPGPDISGAELAALCDHVPAKRQLIVNTTSASGGSMAALEKPGRAVIAATKTGTEKNATVFARYWVEALRDPDRRRGQERSDQRARSLSVRRSQDRRVLRIAKAPGHRACRFRRYRARTSRCAQRPPIPAKACCFRISR